MRERIKTEVNIKMSLATSGRQELLGEIPALMAPRIIR